MLIVLVAFAVAFAVIWAIRKAVENGTRDGLRGEQQPVRRRGPGWHNPNDRRAD